MLPHDHFLDANILIGSRISWDIQYNSAVTYMAAKGIVRHTSKRVYNESRGAFERSRRLILNFLKEFYNKFSKYSNPRKIINSFVNQNSEDLKNVALSGEVGLGDFKKNVIDSINNAINSIDNDCYPDLKAVVCRYDGCPNYYTIDIGYNQILNVINYENDALVLMDSYFIKNNYIKNSVYFVTTDQKHILSW